MSLAELIAKATDQDITIEFSPAIGGSVRMKLTKEDVFADRCFSRRAIDDSNLDLIALELDRAILRFEHHFAK
jgi:hypothetical protein